MSLAGQTVITATILDINTAQILWSSTLQMGEIVEIFAKLPDFVKNLTAPVYKIGDKGPAGGIIFYDKGTYSDGWRYLEAAPAGTDFTAQWGAYNKNVSGISTDIGTGKQNTQLIVDVLRGTIESGTAAQRCARLNIGGFTDWFLPSRDELDLMYKNLKQKGLGGFRATDDKYSLYWSSSQVPNDSFSISAWSQGFMDGVQNNFFLRDSTYSVRAARAF